MGERFDRNRPPVPQTAQPRAEKAPFVSTSESNPPVDLPSAVPHKNEAVMDRGQLVCLASWAVDHKLTGEWRVGRYMYACTSVDVIKQNKSTIQGTKPWKLLVAP